MIYFGEDKTYYAVVKRIKRHKIYMKFDWLTRRERYYEVELKFTVILSEWKWWEPSLVSR